MYQNSERLCDNTCFYHPILQSQKLVWGFRLNYTLPASAFFSKVQLYLERSQKMFPIECMCSNSLPLTFFLSGLQTVFEQYYAPLCILLHELYMSGALVRVKGLAGRLSSMDLTGIGCGFYLQSPFLSFFFKVLVVVLKLWKKKSISLSRKVREYCIEYSVTQNEKKKKNSIWVLKVIWFYLCGPSHHTETSEWLWL